MSDSCLPSNSCLPPNPKIKPSRLPPGQPEAPIVGQTIRYLRDPIGLMEEAARYGDIVTMSFKPWLVYLVSSPELVSEVLVDNHERIGRWRNVEAMKYLMGDGLLTSDGELHSRQRRLMQPAFHRKQIDGFCEAMIKCTLKCVDKWSARTRIDIDDEMRQITLSIVTRCLFGQDFSDDEVRRIGAAVNYANRYLNKRFHLYERVRDLWHYLPLPASSRFRREKTYLDRLSCRMMEQRRGTVDGSQDLLSLLLDPGAQQHPGSVNGGISDRQIVDEIITIFAVGHETVTTALSWTWYLLGKHPEVQSRFHRELDAVLGGKVPALGDLPNLVYTEQVIRESMRLYPPVWRMGRVALEDFELAGYDVVRGTLLCISPYIIHHDRRRFDSPWEFIPERWAPDSQQPLHRFAYIPFGGGHRRCIGERFAWMEMKLIMATIGQNWRVQHSLNHRIDFELLFSLRPKGGMPVFLEPR